MPFESEKQRAYMHAKHPEIANKWEKEAKRKHEAPVKKDIGNMGCEDMLEEYDRKQSRR